MLPAANLARASLSGVYRLFARRDSVRSIRRQGRLAGVGVKPVCGLHRAQIGEDDLATRGAIPQDLLDALPPPEAYENAVFPTIEEQEAMKGVVTGGWDKVVGANVQ